MASVLINYDLPFNPSIVEQRIGRIDRTGQLSDMEIYNFHVENTYDDRLHMILTTKLRLINYFGEYGIGNPLQITDNRSRILESFLKYSDKLEMSNDDIETILRMLRDIYKDVPTIQSVKKDKTVLGKHVSSHTQGIYKWFENVTDRHEKEELLKINQFTPVTIYDNNGKEYTLDTFLKKRKG